MQEKTAMSFSSGTAAVASDRTIQQPTAQSAADNPQTAAADTQESRVPPFSRSLLEELDRQSRAYNQTKSIFASRWSRVTFVVSCLAVAVGAGILGAWWMNNPNITHAADAISKWALAPAASAADPDKAVHAHRSSGTSFDELPYDGMLENSSAEAAVGVATTVRAEEQPYDGVAPAEQLGPEQAASSRATDAAADGNTRAATFAVSAAPTVSPAPVPATLSDNSVKPAPKRGFSPKIARGKEIDRINQQAADELKKKTERRRSVAQRLARAEAKDGADTASFARRSYNTRVSLAQCGNVPSLIGREQCKWQVCGGKWGRNGCPSYGKPNAE